MSNFYLIVKRRTAFVAMALGVPSLLSAGEPGLLTREIWNNLPGVNGWTPVRDWSRYPSQTSAAVALVAGQKYYIEALMKEAGGGDHLEIGWETPGSKSACPRRRAASAPAAR
jgi:hypothetical protein